MNRNDYRRAFIMLRALQPGYGGHVRLEKRTLTGSMYFIISAPQADQALHAALAGQHGGAYYATDLGPLTRDGRGQLTLAWSFDPRAIDGRPLEAYAWVVIARTGGPCAMVLIGNVDGSRAMDAAALGRAVEALYAPQQPPANDLPEPDQANVEAPDIDRCAVPQAPAEPEAQAQPAPPPPAEDIRIYTSTRARQAMEAADEPAEAVHQAAESVEETVEVMAETVEAAETSAAQAPAAEADAAEAVTAARRLGLDITKPWPGGAQSLRRLFATQPPAEATPGGGYTYVRAPMPEQSGCEGCLVGLTAKDGKITGIRYALPGRYAPEPPAGLEGYAWTGDGGEGYWVLDAAP